MVGEVRQIDRDLAKGIQEILTRRFVPTSYFSTSAVLILTGLANTPQNRAQSTGSPPARPKFEVASIKPNRSAVRTMKFPFPYGGRFTATKINLKTLISFAYKLQGFEVSGGPQWIDADRYDVNAKAVRFLFRRGRRTSLHLPCAAVSLPAHPRWTAEE